MTDVAVKAVMENLRYLNKKCSGEPKTKKKTNKKVGFVSTNKGGPVIPKMCEKKTNRRKSRTVLLVLTRIETFSLSFGT